MPVSTIKRKSIYLLVALCLSLRVFSQDLANPSPNLQALPGGSYIIAMDNTWQLNDHITPAKRFFNLKAYGLIVHLLNNNIKVKRIIRSGKLKDEADFSAPTVMIKPISETVESDRSFKAGAFVIMAQDLFNVDVDRLIDYYNNNAGNISGITNSDYRVKVYKTTTAIYDVDVRHDLSGFIPKACILNDGSNATIHQNYMIAAGIPITNYFIGDHSNLTVNCFTFASEPHIGSPALSIVQKIKSFVQSGGNFLAQCHAVASYEELGRFQTSNGISVANTNLPTQYHNADISFAQFEGSYAIKQGGSVQSWFIPANSTRINNTCFIATTNNSQIIGASVSKSIPDGSPGGLVFYVGNHNFSDLDKYESINGIRMYLNAFLTPAYSASQLHHTYVMNCSNNVVNVSTNSGPSVSYPVGFRLYADNGAQQGIIDAGDAFLGMTSVSSSGAAGSIPVSGQFKDKPLLLRIQPSISCFPTLTVSPSNCSFAVLPVSIRSFVAKRLNNTDVSLTWETVDEQQVRGYNIKRKNGDDQWQKIDFIDRNRSNSHNSKYIYKDQNQFFGTTEYRIEEVLLDGSTRASDIRLVKNSSRKISVYPNPSDAGLIHVDFLDNYLKNINVYDIAGRKIKTIQTTAKHVVIENLQRGLYNMIITGSKGETLLTEKIIIKNQY